MQIVFEILKQFGIELRLESLHLMYHCTIVLHKALLISCIMDSSYYYAVNSEDFENSSNQKSTKSLRHMHHILLITQGFCVWKSLKVEVQ